MSTGITIEALGFTQEQLRERFLEKLCEHFLNEDSFDEDGNVIPNSTQTQLAKGVEAKFKAQLDEAIDKLGNEFAKPAVVAWLDGFCLQETNHWGEKTGNKMTVSEYIVARAESYMTACVDNEGRTESECRARGNSWYGTKETRITKMVDDYLRFHIETAMEGALKIANNAIAEGISKTVQIKLAEIIKGIECSVAIKKS